jgi:Arc/MetJ-type ribon-helix-helix transcriptional regulator
MRKTTVYLPEDLKRALDETARIRGESVAEVIREALRALVAASTPPRPRIPLFRSDDPTLAERVDEALAGFGER